MLHTASDSGVQRRCAAEWTRSVRSSRRRGQTAAVLLADSVETLAHAFAFNSSSHSDMRVSALVVCIFDVVQPCLACMIAVGALLDVLRLPSVQGHSVHSHLHLQWRAWCTSSVCATVSDQRVMLGVGLGLGLFCGLLAIKLWKIALFVAGALWSALLPSSSSSRSTRPHSSTRPLHTPPCSSRAVILGLCLSVCMERYWLLFATPILGSFLCMQGVDHFADA